MSTSKSNGKYNLLCVAHPDDETIFFGGLLQERTNKNESLAHDWTVVCVTSDGSAERHRQFSQACSILGVARTEWWAYPDVYENRLPVEALVQRFHSLPRPERIFTHGIVGEYGHPHHQDVSYAVHQAFTGHKSLYSVAYNSFPEFEVQLSRESYEVKARILTQVYGSETSRFLNVLPSTFVEGFHRLDQAEVEAVYDFLARGQALNVNVLKAHRWLESYLPRLRDLPRPF